MPTNRYIPTVWPFCDMDYWAHLWMEKICTVLILAILDQGVLLGQGPFFFFQSPLSYIPLGNLTIIINFQE